MANSNPLQNIFGAIGSAIGGASNFIGQIGQAGQNVGHALQQDFSPAVQRFQQQAAPFVNNIESNVQQMAPMVPIGFNNTITQPNVLSNTLAHLPTLQIPGVQQFENNISQHFGGGIPGSVAGGVAGFVPNLVQSVVNAPQQYGQASQQLQRDATTGNLTPQHAISDIAGIANPVLTLATLPEGGSLLKSLATDGWKMGVLKGLLNGAPIGGAFGLAGGLQQNRDATSVQQQFQQSLPSVLSGMITGGALGALFAPAGKFLFGGKPGEAAALSQHNMLPPQAKVDAGHILGVSPDAPLEDIQNAYMQAINQYHPQFGGTDEAMSALNNSYEMLTQNHAPLITNQDGQMALQWSPEFGGNLSSKQLANARRAMAQTDGFTQKVHNINAGLTETPSAQAKFSMEQPTPEDQALGMQQLQQPTESTNPELSDQELAQQQLQQSNPQLQYPDIESQQLQNLVRIRDGLQAQISHPESTVFDPAADSLVKMRDGLQQEMEQAQSILANKDLYDQKYPNMAKPSEIRAHIRDLKASIKNIDTQTKDMQTKSQAKTTESNARLKAHVDDLNQRIAQEQARLRVNNTISSQEEPRVQGTPPLQAQPTPNAKLLEPELASTPAPVSTPERSATQPAEKLGKSGNQPTFTGTIIADHDPMGKLNGTYRTIAEHLTEATPDNYGTGRQIPKTVEGRHLLADKDAVAIHKAISNELGNPESEKRVLYALDNSLPESQLTPVEKNVYDKVRILLNISYEVAKRVNPDLQPIQNYAPLFATSIDKSSPYAKLKPNALSTSGPQMAHREIRAFEPAESGKALVGTPERLGLQPSGKSGDTFEDANGNQFVVRDATKVEKEGLGIRYEDNASNAVALHLQSVLRGKENFGVREALKGDQYTAVRSNPGEAIPRGFQRATIPGLDKYAFDKDVSKGLNQLSQDWKKDNGSMWDNLANVYAGIESFATKMTLFSPPAHIPNVSAQALLAVGKKNPITGAPLLLKNIPEAIRIIKEQGPEWREYKQMGSNIGEQGERPSLYSNKSQIGQPKNLLQTIKGGLSKLQENVTKPTWQYDAMIKVSAYKALEAQGLTKQEAVNFADKIIGDYGNINPGLERNIVKYGATFYPWLKTEVGSLGEIPKNPAMIGSLALALGVQHAVNQAWQNTTGNPDAKFRVLGGAPQLATDVVTQMNPDQLRLDMRSGKLPPVLYSHLLKPLSREAVQQGLNHDFLRGKAIADTTQSPQQQEIDRRNHLANINPLVNAGMAVESGKKSLPELGQSFLGISTTPHLAGFQAAPNFGDSTIAGLPAQLKVGPLTVDTGFNTPGAKTGTGLDIMHTQEKVNAGLTDQQFHNMQAIKDAEAKNDYKTADQLLLSDPKLFDAKASMAEAEAKANGVPVDPLYDSAHREIAKEYLNFQNKSFADQDKYLAQNPDILNVARARDQYNSDPAVQAYKQQQAKSIGFQYKPYISNPLYASDPTTGQPKFANEDIAAYHIYQSMPSNSLTDSTAKTTYLAQHPQVMQAQIANQPYALQKLQSAWDNRPKGQTIGDFKAQQNNSLFGGVDNDGKIIPAYNLMDEPKYQLAAQHPEAGAMYQIYKAFVANKNYGPADSLAAQHPWILQVDQAQKQYNKEHPFNSEANSALGGLGIDFAGNTKSGSGGSSGYKDYTMTRMRDQFLYNAMGLQPNFNQGKEPALPQTKLRSSGFDQSLYGGRSKLPGPPETSTKSLPKLSVPQVSSGELKIGTGKTAKIQL